MGRLDLRVDHINCLFFRRAMGKSGKHRKRVRLLREHERTASVVEAGSACVRSANEAGEETAEGSDDELDGEIDSSSRLLLPGGIDADDLAITVATLQTVYHDLDLLKTREYKPLRTVLHPVLEALFKMRKAGGDPGVAQEYGSGKGTKRLKRQQPQQDGGGEGRNTIGSDHPSGAGAAGAAGVGRKAIAGAAVLVTNALNAHRWEAAVQQLAIMRKASMVPMLGSVQRWVRACDAAEHDPVMLRMLDVSSSAHVGWVSYVVRCACVRTRVCGEVDGLPYFGRLLGMCGGGLFV